jgi:hypothetical protein
MVIKKNVRHHMNETINIIILYAYRSLDLCLGENWLTAIIGGRLLEQGVAYSILFDLLSRKKKSKNKFIK